MQKAETGLLVTDPNQRPKVATLLTISLDEKNMVYVNWPIEKKELCLNALCEAMKLVALYQPKIIEPPKPRMMDFIRGIKR